MKYKSFLFIAFALLAAVTASAADDPINGGENDVKRNDVVGGVFHNESKKPLGKVSVTVYSATKKEKVVVVTDNNGNYSFNDLNPGSYKFVFEKDGYRKVVKTKTINKINAASMLNIQMEQHSTFDFMPGPSHFFDFE
jgi:hypothetical protein